MVKKLKDLQVELAKAEREAAWKEMAQQVAHEIKNPNPYEAQSSTPGAAVKCIGRGIQ